MAVRKQESKSETVRRTRAPAGRLNRRWFADARKNLELSTIALPGFAFLTIFCYAPMVGIILAFKSFRVDKGIFGSQWIGLKNFEFFFKSMDAIKVTRNTVLYNLAFIIIGTVCALILAILLSYVGERIKAFYKTSLLLPFFLSWVVVDVICYTMLSAHGLFNGVLASLGITGLQWYTESALWPFILLAFNLWKGIGFNTLVYSAGIMGIDPTYYEAARIDGATKAQQVTKITIPLLRPLVTILLILAAGGIMRSDFGLFYFLPRQSFYLIDVTDTIDTYVYRALRVNGDVGMSAAMGFYQSIVGFVLIMITNKVAQKIDNESSLF